jgi:hypothetical protein
LPFWAKYSTVETSGLLQRLRLLIK